MSGPTHYHAFNGGVCRCGEKELAPLQLAPDPFERIELAAAEWRNAYRAKERGDQARLIEHSMRAVAHTLELSAGLR